MTRVDWKWIIVGALLLNVGASVSQAADDADREASRRLRRNHIVEAVEKVRESVVNVATTQRVKARSSIFGMFSGDIFDYPQQTSGSGFVINAKGYIVSNHHVVAQATDLRVRFADGREYEAVVVALDPRYDLAVLKIEPEKPLVPLKLGRSDDIMLGEDVIAIGNPFGLENTITRGVVSAVNRTLELDESLAYRNVIQTDASINPGNSGGPLINAAGELIGINTAIRPDAQNVGFAIPVDLMKDALPEMLDITKLYQVEFGMRVTGERAGVVDLEKNSPAEKAGVKLGDIVTQVDGAAVIRAVDFAVAMLGHRAGDDVALTIERDGKGQTLTVKLKAAPKLDESEIAWRKLGIRLEPISDAAAAQFRLRPDAGLVVSDVDPAGPAGKQGIKQGDLLVGLGQYRAWPLKTVGLILKDVRPNDAVPIALYRFYNFGPPDRLEGRLYAR